MQAAQLFEFDGGYFAVGLEWETSMSGPFTLKQIRNRAGRYKAGYYIAHVPREDSGAVASCGFGRLGKLPPGIQGTFRWMPAVGRGKRASRQMAMYSLASYLATQKSSSFATVVPISTDLCAFIGVLEGQPAQGCDIVGGHQLVLAALTSFLDRHELEGYHFLDGYGQPPFAVPGKAALPFSPAASPNGANQLRQIPTAGISLAGMSALLLVLGVASALGFTALQKRRAIEIATANRITPEQAYLSARNAAFDANTNFAANKAVQEAVGRLEELPTVTSDWLLSKVTCLSQRSVSAPFFRCTASWTTPGQAKFDQFELPSQLADATVTFDPGLAMVQSTFHLSIRTRPMNTDQLAIAPSMQKYLRTAGSLFQDLRALEFKTSFAQASALGGQSPSPGTSATVWTMPWAMKGPSDLMQTASAAMPANMTVETITLEIPTESASQAARSRPLEPMAPHISVTGIAYVQ